MSGSKTVKANIVTFFSLKGGVGKTTLITNLAGIYEQLQKRVLLIDFDLYSGSIGMALNLPSNKNLYYLYQDILERKYDSLTNYVEHYSEYIDVLCAPIDPRQASMMKENYLLTVLENAQFMYDIILVDTNHQLSDYNVNLLDVSNEIMFVINNDPISIRNTKSLISIFKDSELDHYKVLLNQSRDPYKSYFTLFDIKKLLNTNIDYVISSEFYIKNMDFYIMNGKLITNDPSISKVFAKDYSALMTIAADLLKVGEE